MTKAHTAELLEILRESEYIFQTTRDGLRRVIFPTAHCVDAKGERIGYLRHAELMELVSAGFVVSPSEDWYLRRGGRQPHTDYYLPAPNLPSSENPESR